MLPGTGPRQQCDVENSLSDLGFLMWKMEALSFTEKGTVVEPHVLSRAQRLPHTSACLIRLARPKHRSQEPGRHEGLSQAPAAGLGKPQPAGACLRGHVS